MIARRLVGGVTTDGPNKGAAMLEALESAAEVKDDWLIRTLPDSRLPPGQDWVGSERHGWSSWRLRMFSRSFLILQVLRPLLYTPVRQLHWHLYNTSKSMKSLMVAMKTTCPIHKHVSVIMEFRVQRLEHSVQSCLSLNLAPLWPELRRLS